MGDIKKKRKMFSRPKKLYDRTRMDEEDVLVKKFGLKNKREIWKAKSAVSKLRRRAKGLIGKDIEEQRAFFEKLNKIGFKIVDISDVLALTEEDIFARRLQTFLVGKKLATTTKGARQLIVHKNVLVDGDVVNIPSFVVTRELEDKISLKEKKVKAVVEEVVEAPAEAPEGVPPAQVASADADKVGKESTEEEKE
ncbi:MAG TPA: 30S ribosomal protein S4 [Candidatus Pacearchaeota archaeon]|nr:30S ribosomal protein S4 [Candidatus Pacearchaeota archaeon]